VKRFVALVAFSFPLLGQTVEPEMTADRPGFRNSTHLVGPGVVQLENGLRFSREHVLGLEPELRLGTFSWLELRLKAESVVLRSPDEAPTAGTSDLQVGVKFPVFNRIKNTRVVAVLESTVPSGHGSQTTGGYEPGAELIWEHKLTEDFSLAGTWNLTRLKKEQFLWQRAASVSANNNFGEALRAFAEVYVLSPKELGAGNDWTIDAGVMRVIGKFLMIDLAAGHSVHGPSNWFMTVGFSVRTRVPYMRRSPF
jgi:hypothetical protein